MLAVKILNNIPHLFDSIGRSVIMPSRKLIYIPFVITKSTSFLSKIQVFL